MKRQPNNGIQNRFSVPISLRLGVIFKLLAATYENFFLPLEANSVTLEEFFKLPLLGAEAFSRSIFGSGLPAEKKKMRVWKRC